MLETPVMLSYLPYGTDQGVGLPSILFQSLGIPLNQPITLSWPGQSVCLTVYLNQSQAPIIHLPSDLASLLHLPDESVIHISYHPSTQTLRIKPILAILVSNTQHPHPFGQLNDFLREVILTARRRAVVAYVITIHDLLGLNPPLSGWTWEKGTWKKRGFPLPHVVYNRIPSRRIERSNLYKTLKSKLATHQIFLFNQTFLNKWETHTILSSNNTLKKYLPNTLKFDRANTLETMLTKYPVIFLKPIHGSLGKGIYKIRRTATGFESAYSTLSGEMIRHFSSLKSLIIYLSKRIKRPYVIQEGINILHYEGRPVDFRILMQKNRKGQWSVTSLVARIGAENRIVSNVSRGGEIAGVMTTLKQCNISNPTAMRSKLAAVAKRVAQVIDQEHEGLFGELGIDLAISTNEQIYILEANSKPSKTQDALPDHGRIGKGRPSVQRLLDYTFYLTKLSHEVE
jgi:glutathione synthase/RimK-type ligase-like ATP-grasp enzyme